ncbi:MAG TPA: tetratricopeptide repeat protein [Bacteroidia bacterium]
MSKKKKNTIQKNPSQRPAAVKPIAKSKALDFWRIYLLLFVLACGLYSNTIKHEFAFDDSVVITGNKYTKQGFDGIKTLATKDLFYGIYGNSLDLEGGRWRPLTLVMFAIEYHFFGDNAHPYHLINIFLYGITALILFLTLKEFFPRNHLLAFLATLLFIAHPIHTEVVANIKSCDEIMSFLLLCLMLFFLFRFVKTEKKKFILYSTLCYFLALLSKENGITFIAVIPLALFCFGEKNIRQSLMLTIPFFSTAVIYFLIRTHYVGIIGDRPSNDMTDNPFMHVNFPALPTQIPFIEKFATVCWILLKYLMLLVFPHPLTSDYAFNEIPAISLADPKAIVSILIYAGLFFYAVKILWSEYKFRNQPETISNKSETLLFSFAILFHIITISIVSNLFFLIGTNMGERFVYITSLGFCIALAALLIKLFKWDVSILRNPSSGLIKLSPVLLILIPYSIKTYSRNPVWKNNQTLFAEDVKTSTGSANVHYYYANTLFTDHMNDDPSPQRDSIYREAKKEFTKAKEINPYFHYCYYNIGLIWEKLGQPDSAIVWQTKAINLKPENSMAQYMAKGALGLVYGKLKGDIGHAIPLLKEAIANKPDDTGYHENLGICYAMKGDYDNSINEFETSLKLKTELKKEDARIFMNLALSWQNKGNKQKYDENLQKAFQIDPSLKK